MAAAFFTTASGNIFNDIRDIEIDKINRPQRPLPSGFFSISQAYFFYFLFLLLSVFLGFSLSSEAATIIILAQILLILYSFRLKSTVLAGNLLIGVLTAAAFIFGAQLGGEVSRAFFPALIAGFANVLREIVKDIQDIEGDQKGNLGTLPLIYGVHSSLIVIICFASLFILTSIYPFLQGYYSIYYLIIVFIFVHPFLVYSLKMLINATDSVTLGKVSRNLKIIMVIGILALYAGR